VMRTILTSPEFLSPSASYAKVKSPFEYVASVLRATQASVNNPRAFVGTIGALGEPLYQCQPPTGYTDRATFWMNTGALIGRLNFAQSVASNGANASTLDLPKDPTAVEPWADAVLGDLSPQARQIAQAGQASAASRIGLLLGSPEFQRR